MATTRETLRVERARERAQRFRGMPDTILRRIVADENAMFDKIPFPPSYPAYGRVVVDAEQFIWVENLKAGQPTQTWSVFHSDGMWLGDVILPPRFTLHHAGVQHIIGVQTDDLGVEYVRVFPIMGRSLDAAAR
jgi:hypothetical protein